MPKIKNKAFWNSKIKSIDQEKRQAIFIFSDGDEDRHGDSLNPNGWKVDNYMKNPVVMFGHDYRGLPIGKTIKTWVEDGKTFMGLIEFATTEFAEQVWQLILGGFLNAGSVGFIPLRYDETGEYTFQEMELLEYSIVPIPANPRALTQKHLEICKSLEQQTNYKLLDEEKSQPSPAATPTTQPTSTSSEDPAEGSKTLATLTSEQFSQLITDAVAAGVQKAKDIEPAPTKESEESPQNQEGATAKVLKVMKEVRQHLKDSDKATGLALRTIKELESNT